MTQPVPTTLPLMPLAAGGGGAAAGAGVRGSVRYTCIPHSSLGAKNPSGGGSAAAASAGAAAPPAVPPPVPPSDAALNLHVNVSVRSLRCDPSSPLLHPFSAEAGESDRDAAGEEAGDDEKKTEDSDNLRRSRDGGTRRRWQGRPFGGTFARFGARWSERDREVRITASLHSLGRPAHAAAVTTRSVPLMPPVPTMDNTAADEPGEPPPPPARASGLVARFGVWPERGVSQPPMAEAESPRGLQRRDRRHHRQRQRQQQPSQIRPSREGEGEVGGEVLTLPVPYGALTRDSTIRFEVYAAGPAVAATVATAELALFDELGRLRVGPQRIRLVCKTGGNNGGGNDYGGGSTSSAMVVDVADDEDGPAWDASLVLNDLDRLGGGPSAAAGAATSPSASASAPAEDGSGNKSVLPRPGPNLASSSRQSVPWLDALTRQRCRAELDEWAEFGTSSLGGSPSGEEEGGAAYLMVDLPNFDVPVVYGEGSYPPPTHGASGTVTAYDLSLYGRRRRAEAAAKASRGLRGQRNSRAAGGQGPERSVRNEAEDGKTPELGRGEGGSGGYGYGYPHLHPQTYDDYDAGLSLVTLLDPTPTSEDANPTEDKYRTLAHDLLRGHIDPTLKPSRVQRARLSSIISSPSRHPTNEERDLLWRFRFSLVDDRRALSKFLLAVDWTQESEVVQAAELLEQWRKRSPIEVTDALRLLGKDVAFRAGLVRGYAIDTLAEAEDGELRLYLLQLVQALKYEDVETVQHPQVQQPPKGSKGRKAASAASAAAASSSPGVSSLATFLIERSARNLELANYLYWYLKVELADPTYGPRYRSVFDALRVRLSSARVGGGGGTGAGGSAMPPSSSSSSSPSAAAKVVKSALKGVGAKLGSSLLHVGHPSTGHHHHHPADPSSSRSLSSSSARPLASSSSHSHHSSSPSSSLGRSSPTMWDVLTAQDAFVSGVMDCQSRSRDARGKKDAKESHLRESLSDGGFGRVFRGGGGGGVDSIPLPSAPSVMVTGVRPETARMFKSALYPAVVEFTVGGRGRGSSSSGACRVGHGREVYTTRSELSAALAGTDGTGGGGTGTGTGTGGRGSDDRHRRQGGAGGGGDAADGTFKVIVKTGDDLRQDQLVIMMIQLMDRLLKRATLDLCLRPYAILATSSTTGLVEFVDGSVPVSQILANHQNSIMQYFRTEAPAQDGAPYGVDRDVIRTYIRSCAGYCVITYLLGVGDRHLDNIMLLPTGHFFHIDFGFIFGRDPKPLPPAFRLTREMVDGMGGTDSSEYRQFCSLACQAFNSLRKSAGLVLNLLHLMGDAGIEDLSNNPSADAEGVIAKVEERFRLELTDEQAEAYFLGLISDSLAALAPRVMEVFHQLSVARR